MRPPVKAAIVIRKLIAATAAAVARAPSLVWYFLATGQSVATRVPEIFRRQRVGSDRVQG